MIVCLTACTTTEPVKKDKDENKEEIVEKAKEKFNYNEQYYNSYFYKDEDGIIYFTDGDALYKIVDNQVSRIYNYFDNNQLASIIGYCCGYKDYLYTLATDVTKIEDGDFSAYLVKIKKDGSDFEVVDKIVSNIFGVDGMYIVEDKIYLGAYTNRDGEKEFKTYKINDNGVTAINEENNVFVDNYQYLIKEYPNLKLSPGYQALLASHVFYLIDNKLYVKDSQYLYEIYLDKSDLKTEQYDLGDLIPGYPNFSPFNLIDNEWYVKANKEIYKTDMSLKNKIIFIDAMQRKDHNIRYEKNGYIFTY